MVNRKSSLFVILLTAIFVFHLIPFGYATDAPEAMWEKTFGGTGWDFGSSVQATSDGGFIITGGTGSFGAIENDVYLVRTNSTGNMIWNKTFGGWGRDYGYSVQVTSDGGFIITGFTGSSGSGGNNVYLIKTDSSGNLVWETSFGGTASDGGYSIQVTGDGGYIITGVTLSSGAGGSDVYLVKTDSGGNLVWEKTFGGTGSESGSSVQVTADGGYIITGHTTSFGAGETDVYLVKTDSTGTLQWEKTFGGIVGDSGSSVQVTDDGGYIITGNTLSYGVAGETDVYLIRTDSDGNLVWEKTFGGTGSDYGSTVQVTADGGYIITGHTTSFGAGETDVYLVKTDSTGTLQWEKTFGGTLYDVGYSVQVTSDGGYIITGDTRSSGAGSADVYLVRTDPQGEEISQEETYSAWIVDVVAPSEVSVGEVFTVDVTVSYDFTVPTEIKPGVFEYWTHETLVGTGTKTYSFVLDAPEEEGVWSLSADVWYSVEGAFVHDDVDWVESFNVQVTVVDAGGTISSNTIWMLENSPYIITETVHIPFGVTLTIEPGVSISKPTSGDMFLLNGEIYAHGTINENIIFDGGYNSNIFSPRQSTAETFADLEYCVIRNGISFWPATGSAQYGHFNLSHSEIINLSSYSYIWYPQRDVHIEYNFFNNSAGFSIGHSDANVYVRWNQFVSRPVLVDYMDYWVQNWASYGDSQTIVQYNSFLNVGEIAVKLPEGYSSSTMVATENYWGTQDGNIIASMIFDKNDDETSAGYINYSPILTHPHPDTPSGARTQALQYELTITVDGNGTTDPSPGSHLYTNGTLATVTAITPFHIMIAGVQFSTFDHWLLDDADVGDAINYTVTMDQNHTLQAVFTLSNLRPVANADGPYSGNVNETIAFDGTGSTDSDGTIESYAWTFGDGDTGTGVSPSHTYTDAGTYWVILTVTDDGGLTHNDSATVTVIELLPDTGTLSITTTPVSGTVLVNGASWGAAPASQVVEVGSYTVSFEAVTGYTTPASQSAVVTADTATTITGVYARAPSLPPILSNLVITPAELESGGEVTISLDIENIDSQSFTYTVTIQIGELTLLNDVELEAYESKTVSRTITQDIPGDYIVTVDGLTGSFTVNAPPQPAEFEFSGLRIFYPGVNPPVVESGQTATVTVSIEVENVGELEGGQTVELRVDGEVVDSMEVTLGGGASDTILFELTRGEGIYEVEVEGFMESFTVNAQPESKPEQRGIPGFPYLSLILGLLIALVLHLRNQS